MAGIGEDAGKRSPGRGSDAGEDSFERMFVPGEIEAGADQISVPAAVMLWRLEIAAQLKPNIDRRSRILSPR
jgi:hypothetical protein